MAQAVIVLSRDRTSREVDVARMHTHFSALCRAVLEGPYDPNLATGGRIEMASLAPETTDAFLELADEFGGMHAASGS